MPTPNATLDGLPLDSSSPVGWTFQPGAEPHRRAFTVAAGVAQQLLAQARPGESVFSFDVPGHGIERVEKLTILGVGPASEPDLATVEVADLRWLLRDRRVYGRFNVRRRTGERRRVAANAPLAVQPINDDVAFAAWSLDGLARYTAGNLLRRVLTRLLRPGEHFEIRPLSVRSLPVEDLVLDDDGNGGLRRLAAYFAGIVDYFVDGDGTLVVYDRMDGSERSFVGLAPDRRSREGSRTRRGGEGDASPPSVVGPPLWSFVDRSLERPSEFKVLLSRLVELRFDGQDTPTGGGTRTERDDVPLELEMVLRVPDLSLQIPALNGRQARTVLKGAWITFEEALAAWNVAGWPRAVARTLSLTEIRNAVVRDRLFALYAPAKLDEEGIYARRLHALFTSFRTHYRIVRRWRDRLGELFAARAELADVENGTWTPSEVYADYSTQLTRRGQEKAITQNPENMSVFVNRYAAGEGVSVKAASIGTMKPSPALLVVEDQDQGVLRLNWVLEPAIGELNIVPSAIQRTTIPSMDPAAPITRRSVGNARFTETHEVSVVLSTMPVAPNDTRALHQEKVTPAEAEAFVGFEAGAFGPCRGQAAEIRIHSMNRRACARHAWDDARAAEIRGAFQLRGEEQENPDTAAFGEPLNPDEIKALAHAAVARFLLSRRDQIEGALTTGWMPGARPTGNAGPVTYTIDTTGAALTTIVFPRVELGDDVFALLPEHVRQVVLGEVIA